MDLVVPPTDFRLAGLMLGHAFDRAVTASVRYWWVIAIFWAAWSSQWLLTNVFLRSLVGLTIEFVWVPVVAVIAIRSVGFACTPTLRRLGTFWLTNLQWYLMLGLPVVFIFATYFFTVSLGSLTQPVTNGLMVNAVGLAGIIVVLFCLSRLALAPIVSLVRGLSPRDAFRESGALTKGRFLFSATVMSLGYIAAIVPYFALYNGILSAFGAPELHLGGVSETERMAIANILALPFSLFGALASWAAQALLMRWLQGDRPNREAEGLA